MKFKNSNFVFNIKKFPLYFLFIYLLFIFWILATEQYYPYFVSAEN